ncbi:MAG TPA: peptidylprolyl isomerase [Xanthobacteraceae bacterium]|nr:peptidylprolyl isomerase [Xanthobacteraceae bacterium]
MRLRSLPILAIAASFITMMPGLALAQKSDDPVLARVDGVEIHQSDLALAEADIGSSLPPVQGDQRRDALLSYLIDVNVLSHTAETSKVDQVPGFPQKLDFARKKVMVETLLDQQAKNSVSDKDIKKFYDDNLKPQTEVHARHILVETEAQAKDVAAKLKGGADFAQLAKEVSKDPGSDGGDLGFITKDQVVPEFGEAAFKLDKGKISDPVKSQFGWHIIKIEDKRERKPPAFDAVKDRIKVVLMQKANEDFVTKARQGAKIERLDAKPDEAKKN